MFYPMQSLLLPQSNSLLKQTLITLTGVLVLAMASQLCIPLSPVPLTFQSATVILIGMALGARQGAYIVSAYLAAGALGFPVFAEMHGGFPVFFGADGGYLLGFLPAAYLSGYLAEKGWAKYAISSFFAALAGASIIFLSGLSVLSTFVGWQQAIALGLLPFVVFETFKLLAVALFVPRLWKKS